MTMRAPVADCSACRPPTWSTWLWVARKGSICQPRSRAAWSMAWGSLAGPCLADDVAEFVFQHGGIITCTWVWSPTHGESYHCNGGRFCRYWGSRNAPITLNQERDHLGDPGHAGR